MENEMIDNGTQQPATPAAGAPAGSVEPSAGNPAESAAGAEGGTGTPPAEVTRNDPPQWAVRRIGELTAARKAAEERAAQQEAEATQLRQQIEQYRLGDNEDALRMPSAQSGAGNQNVQQLAQALAENMTREQVQKQMQQLNVAQRAKTVEEAGRKEFGDEFDRSVQNLGMAGISGAEFLEAVTSVPNAEKIVRYLGAAENIDEAVRISQLPPLQMGIELMRLSPKAVQTYAKPVSSAPAPITPIEGRGRADDGEPDPKDTKAYIDWRNKTARRQYR